MARLAAALAAFVVLNTAAFAAYQLNDRVSVFVSGAWYPGTVIGIGSGDYAGDYYVKFDSGGQQYAQPQNIEPLAADAAAAGDATATAAYRLNDRVNVYVSGAWYPGTVVGFGSGDYAGEYYIKFDGGGQQYAQPKNIEPLAGGTDAANAGGGQFAAGLYTCVGFDGATYRWSLAFGTNAVYQQQKPDTEAGYYSVSGDTISFTSGNYADNGWFGKIVSESGQTIVVLRSIANEQQGPRVNEYENFYCHLSQ